MYKNKVLTLAVLIFVAAIIIISCKKIPKGYISDNLYYNLNPMIVPQGTTTVSEGLVADGTTTPISVKLLGIRDLVTGEDVSKIFLKPDTVVVFKNAIYYTDSTLALLSAKLTDSTLAPFSVGAIGGRLQFTQATQYVPGGKYTIDVQASNIRGTKILDNACTIDIVAQRPDSILYVGYTQATSAFVAVNFPPVTNLHCSIAHNPAGPNKVIFVFKDKKGNDFDPLQGQVVNRPSRPYWHDWDPYYPQVKTDTSIEYGYPAGVPQMPIFASSSYSGFSTGITYYAVLGKYNDIGLNLDGVITPAIYATKGSYVITMQFTDANKIQ